MDQSLRAIDNQTDAWPDQQFRNDLTTDLYQRLTTADNIEKEISNFYLATDHRKIMHGRISFYAQWFQTFSYW